MSLAKVSILNRICWADGNMVSAKGRFSSWMSRESMDVPMTEGWSSGLGSWVVPQDSAMMRHKAVSADKRRVLMV